jgi:hypothetical protein
MEVIWELREYWVATLGEKLVMILFQKNVHTIIKIN